MAAACGDDDGDGNGGGGSGGQGASGGTGGTGGGGSSGAAGAAGEAGSAGLGGTAGQPNGGAAGTSGGTAGSSSGSSGAAGSSAGSGGEPPDAGPDGSVESDASTDPPDSGGPVDPVDSGVNGDCVGFTTGLNTLDPQNNQDVVIARVIFNDDGVTATAVLRVINAFAFGGDQVLCWGATNSECAAVDDGITGAESPVGAEIPVVVGTVDDPIDVDEGELLFAAETPENDPNVFAYVNWGDFDSADVDDGGPLLSLEGMADAAGFWTLGDSIDLDNDDNAFFVLGDTSTGAGFDGCTADQF